MISIPIWLLVILAIPTALIIIVLISVIIEAIVITIQERRERK